MTFVRHNMPRVVACMTLTAICALTLAVSLAGCDSGSSGDATRSVDAGAEVQADTTQGEATQTQADDAAASTEGEDAPESQDPNGEVDETQGSSEASSASVKDNRTPAEIRATLNITEDFREEFIHGEKPAEFQKYIVMHDTEGEGEASNVIDWWASNGNLVASHFVVNKDGSIVQCVPLDKIAHHAGFGDAGHNESYGVTDESRDDKEGTKPIGDWAPDYGMNSYSVGIEMVHMGETHEGYPEEQLKAVDGLIAYIDAYYGFQSDIIEHSDWRTGNSDCSEEFQPFLQNLQTTRTHDGS